MPLTTGYNKPKIKKSEENIYLGDQEVNMNFHGKNMFCLFFRRTKYGCSVLKYTVIALSNEEIPSLLDSTRQ